MSVITQQHKAELVLLIQSLHVKPDTFTPSNGFESSAWILFPTEM